MRKWLLFLTVGLLGVSASATGVSAAPRSVVEFDFVSFSCALSDGDTPGSVFFDHTTAFGPFVEVAIGDELFGFTDDPQDVTVGDGTAEATVELFDSEGNPAGEAVLEATFTTTGEPEPIDERFRDGNTVFHDTGFIQPIEVTGTVTAISTTFELTGCEGSTGHIRSVSNSPDAIVFIERRFVTLDCFVETSEGFAFLFAISDRFGVFADLFTSEGQGFDEDPVFTTSEFHASFELFDLETGEPTGETATADATLTASGTPTPRTEGRFKRVSRELEVEGTLSVPGLGDLDLSACNAEEILVSKFLRTSPHVRPPANDLPDDAIAIAPGDQVTVRTGGAAVLGEAPTECLGAPPGYSVWYTLEGTGGEVTLDPAGSDFDTVIAVYTRDGDAFTEVTCIDDDEDFQGALTIDTEAGVTYWIQVGGFFEDFGTLVLEVS